MRAARGWCLFGALLVAGCASHIPIPGEMVEAPDASGLWTYKNGGSAPVIVVDYRPEPALEKKPTAGVLPTVSLAHDKPVVAALPPAPPIRVPAQTSSQIHVQQVGYWTICVASFGREASASTLARRLQAQGLATEVVVGHDIVGSTVYRVSVGEFPSVESARAYALKLVRRGYRGAWILHV